MGFSEAMAQGLRRGYIPGPNHPCRRLLEGERIAHCPDLAQIDDPVTGAAGVALSGVGTILFVALRKEDALLGKSLPPAGKCVPLPKVRSLSSKISPRLD